MARRQRGEGSIFQRHDHPTCPPVDADGNRPEHKPCRGRWVGRIDLGNGKRRTVYARTQAEAVKAVRAAHKEKDAGNLSTTNPTVEKWLTYWLDEVCPGKPRMKPKTLRNYRSYVENYLTPALGKKRLGKLTPEDVRTLHRYVTDKGKSSTTAHHAHRILSASLNDAMRDGRVTRNVATLVPAPPLAASTKEALTLDQFVRLMRHLDGDRMQSRWAFGLFTGARQGECLGLTWPHVDLAGGVADLAWQLQRIPYRHGCGRRNDAGEWPCGRKRADRCTLRELAVQPGFEYRRLDGNLCLQRPKTKGSTRLVPIVEPLLTAMRERHAQYLAERRGYTKDHGLVWARTDGRPIDGRQDWQEWADHLKALEIEHQALHVARHTASTILLALGVPENVRMAILGHSEAATNRLYSHVDLTMQRQAMETYGSAVAALLGTPPGPTR